MVFSHLKDIISYLSRYKENLPDRVGNDWLDMTLRTQNDIYMNNFSNVINKLILNYDPKILIKTNMNN